MDLALAVNHCNVEGPDNEAPVNTIVVCVCGLDTRPKHYCIIRHLPDCNYSYHCSYYTCSGFKHAVGEYPYIF